MTPFRPASKAQLKEAFGPRFQVFSMVGHDIYLYTKENFRHRNFSGLHIQHVVFDSCDFSGCDFSGAQMPGINVGGCSLVGANMTVSSLVKAEAGPADFTNADMTGVFAYRCSFFESVLRRADFSSADLRSTHLRGADLTGANLSGADLRHAGFGDRMRINGAHLWGARGLADVILISKGVDGLICIETEAGELRLSVDNARAWLMAAASVGESGAD